MSDLFIGVMFMIILYCVGKVLYPDTQYKPMQKRDEEE